MNHGFSSNKFSRVGISLVILTAGHALATDLSTVPLNTYSATSSTDIKPNLMFILDDSGSMDWDFMPDNSKSGGDIEFLNASFNGLAYNPGNLYVPPTVVTSSSGVQDTTTYPSIDGTSTSRGADSAPKPNWNAVKDDAYGVQSPYTSNLTPTSTRAPYFYTTVPGEYCTNTGLRNCIAASSPTGSYSIPAYLRWCNSSAQCQVTYDSAAGFTTARHPTPRTATISISGISSTSVSGITVDGKQIMESGTATTTTPSALASAIVAQINNCTFSTTGSCTTLGYMAYRSGSTITINAPNVTNGTPVFTKSGPMTITAAAFTTGSTPGEMIRTTIVPAIAGKAASYVYPGTNSPASVRGCAASGCTYGQEMTNYANWWTYYHTRMQMMKTSTSNAFANLDSSTDLAAGKSRFRVGFTTINNNQGSAFLNIGEFTGSQKFNWYSKLLAAVPDGSTPSRKALADVGRIYAGKSTGSRLNDVKVVDPVQYSCQNNYALLSTDGFWNDGAGYKIDGSSAVGNPDIGDPAPYGGDGASDTLADVAAYYYKTDLRSATAADGTGTCIGPIIFPNTTANNLCTNNVQPAGRDIANWQHMTTFTLGLGAQGKMVYAPQMDNDYWKDTSGDFYDIKNKTLASPSTGVCPWMPAGTTCTWPTPSSDSNANIDDLWHAAISGHGTYFSAKDPTSLSTSLKSVLSAIANVPTPGTSAAAASSQQQP